MTWRFVLPVILAAVIVVGGLTIVYATPGVIPQPPEACACPDIHVLGPGAHIVFMAPMPAQPVITVSPTLAPTPADSVTLTNADRGSTLLMLVGDTITIGLPPTSGPPTVPGAVLQRATGPDPTEPVYRAATPGATTITAAEPGSTWRVTVTVG
ncbi:MAG TPA: hypothetical protein VHX38_28455 [Pseudonocardiaceae bacterium]|jgi:hypothetical protein|nr:hypothetical protein [Pseudonocardiaceae bacterium]